MSDPNGFDLGFTLPANSPSQAPLIAARQFINQSQTRLAWIPTATH